MKATKVATVLVGAALLCGTLMGTAHAMDRQDKAHRALLSEVHTCWSEYNADMPGHIEGICGTADGIPRDGLFLHWGLPQDGEQAGDYN